MAAFCTLQIVAVNSYEILVTCYCTTQQSSQLHMVVHVYPFQMCTLLYYNQVISVSFAQPYKFRSISDYPQRSHYLWKLLIALWVYYVVKALHFKLWHLNKLYINVTMSDMYALAWNNFHPNLFHVAHYWLNLLVMKFVQPSCFSKKLFNILNCFHKTVNILTTKYSKTTNILAIYFIIILNTYSYYGHALCMLLMTVI